jgi:hypothetical protein
MVGQDCFHVMETTEPGYNSTMLPSQRVFERRV